jgi:hypothetical protein
MLYGVSPYRPFSVVEPPSPATALGFLDAVVYNLYTVITLRSWARPAVGHPSDSPESFPPAATFQISGGDGLSSKTILLIEDNPSDVALTKRVLENESPSVIAESSAYV